MNRCGCNPVPGPYEFPIIEKPIKRTSIQIECCESEPDYCGLKAQIISEFLDILQKLECGIQPDLEVLLEEISIIYINEE